MAAAEERAEGDAVVVWPENRQSLEVFLAVGTQWRRAGMDGAQVGLDHGAVHAAIALFVPAEKRRRAVFEDVLAMEAAALRVFTRETAMRRRKTEGRRPWPKT